MIMVGKIIVSIIWVFWMMAMSSVEGQDPMKERLGVGVPKSEYNPTYSSTFERVKKRGHVICGTNDEFPGFSQEIWNNEDGDRWEGFDVDIRSRFSDTLLHRMLNIANDVFLDANK